ncbi:MAG: endonuclease/exonuclease/phosphatase family protein [Anaerolineales bacterium]|nr:endonuclease/exonuclease/phosphatase family protein [Anaerolineales bacterium]
MASRVCAVKVLAYNMDGGAAERLPALTAVLQHAGADVVALTEANDEAVVQKLAAHFNFQPVWARGSGDKHVALLSRWPITVWQIHNRPPLTQAVLEVTLQPNHHSPITIFNIHFLPYLLLPFELHRWRAVGALLQRIRQQNLGPHLIVGDLNAIAPGDRVLQKNNPARMRRVQVLQFNLVFHWALSRLLKAGYVDCFRQANPHADGFTWRPGNLTTRYDYVLAHKHFAPRLRACRVVDDASEAASASDHLPVLAEFEL